MISKRIHSFKYAINGFRQVVKTEVNMQIHLFLSVLAIVLGFVFSFNMTEFSFILICIAMVWSAEIFNTVVEKYLDFYHPERSDKVAILKDMSAGAVLVVSGFSFVIGLLLFMPKIWGRL